jgi:hypothetical protein
MIGVLAHAERSLVPGLTGAHRRRELATRLPPRQRTPASTADAVLAALAAVGRVLRPGTGRLVFIVVLAAIAIEAILAFRFWSQLNREMPEEGFQGWVFDVSSDLVSPFERLEPVPSDKSTGIIEVATVAAMDAYLIGMLVLIFLIFLVSRVVGMLLKTPRIRPVGRELTRLNSPPFP